MILTQYHNSYKFNLKKKLIKKKKLEKNMNHFKRKI